VLDKVCSVTVSNTKGNLELISVIARSRNAAAALALEELIKQHRWSADRSSKIEVTVHEPGPKYAVTIEQIVKWANLRQRGEQIGVVALKRRILELFSQR